MTTTQQLIDDARHEINHRSRGSAERRDRLQAAGLPLDSVSLRKWRENELDRLHEATPGAVFLIDTVRVDHGVDDRLLTIERWGCRVTRYTITASLYDGSWIVQRPLGSTSVVEADGAETEASVVADARRGMIDAGHAYATFAAAKQAVEESLRQRVAAKKK